MNSNQLNLFRDKRFLPIFIVQFCGCLNDSILKNALIILITFKLCHNLSVAPYLLVMLANTLFIAPFVLFGSLAGQLADRYERATLVKIVKLGEIAIILLSAYGFYYTNLPVLFLALGLMGAHSTFFGPIKYSVLPDQLKKEELLRANGYVEAGTFMSILLGTIIGGFYNFSGELVIATGITVSMIGFAASFFMPESGNSNPAVKINLNIFQESVRMVKYAYNKTQVYLAILGISWFWFIGAAILAQIPLLTRETLGADESVANLFLIVFSFGVGAGSALCNKIFAGNITTKYVFLAAIGISFFGVDLYFASCIAEISYEPEQLKSIAEFLSKGHYWRILIDLFFLAAISGLYVVPLFTVMQCFSSPAHRSRIIAANNLMNSFFMAGSTALLSLLFYLKFSVPTVILVISLINLAVAAHIYKLIPASKTVYMKLWKGTFRIILNCSYRIEVKGTENYRRSGKRTVIIANHMSYIDPLLIAAYIPENIQFAINITAAKKWWVRPFLQLARTFPIDPSNPMAIKSLIEEVKKNRKIAIFPEGRISLTGTLMKVYEGPAVIADKAAAYILPIRVDGTQFTCFSKSKKSLKGRFIFRRKIIITMLPAVKLNPPEELGGKERRIYNAQALYDIMSDMTFDSSDYRTTLFQSLINSAKSFGMATRILEDNEHNEVSYRSIIFQSFLLREIISRQTEKKENTGLMMPTSAASMIAFFAISITGRVPAIINFTSGAENIISSCKTARIKTIYSSGKFIEKAELSELVQIIKKAGISFVYLEDLRKSVNPLRMFKALAGSMLPQTYYNLTCVARDDNLPAVILFTSGTEGRPKAVVLSHRNIQANRIQASTVIDFTPHDIAFNALPIFHGFGLTGTLIMLLSGVKTFLYPSPLHYRMIPEIVYGVGATIMFGTDSFLAGYAAAAHPYDFYSIKYVVAGAEKLKETTRQLWLEKFGIRIFEAYGATEASPAIALNTPMHYKAGSVGRLLPKIEYFLQPVQGIKSGGRLYIKGPNIMLGYIKPEAPGVIEPPFAAGQGKWWYDTGDIVSVDSDGYITILGRQKRFAKIMGEMVSLAAVEELAAQADNKADHAAVCTTDDKKGEQILLFTNSDTLTEEQLAKEARKSKASMLSLPKIIVKLADFPVLASGKINYLQLEELAREKGEGS